MSLSVICENCGKEIQIPEGLNEFSCVYCGYRMRMPETDVDRDSIDNGDLCPVNTLAEELVKCVSQHLDIHKNFNKYTYSDTIDSYKAQHFPALSAINSHISQLEPSDRASALLSLARDFISGVEDIRLTDRRYKSLLDKGIFYTDMRMIMAIYMIPAMLNTGLECSKPLAEAIRKEWLDRHPKEPFNIGTRESIQGGFKKRLCFISTCVCRSLGKGDDCAELRLLRSFRDGYMCSTHEGQALVGEYYDIGPLIAVCIQLCDDTEAVLSSLYREYIQPCVQDIKEGRERICKLRYIHMIRSLEDRYLRHPQ